MKKFIDETYYTCTFKTVHTLNDLNDKELSKIDQRTDGDVEVIDVKLNNRKTKKIGDNKNQITFAKKGKFTIKNGTKILVLIDGQTINEVNEKISNFSFLESEVVGI